MRCQFLLRRLSLEMHSKTEDCMDTSIYSMECQNDASNSSNYVHPNSELHQRPLTDCSASSTGKSQYIGQLRTTLLIVNLSICCTNDMTKLLGKMKKNAYRKTLATHIYIYIYIYNIYIYIYIYIYIIYIYIYMYIHTHTYICIYMPYKCTHKCFK